MRLIEYIVDDDNKDVEDVVMRCLEQLCPCNLGGVVEPSSIKGYKFQVRVHITFETYNPTTPNNILVVDDFLTVPLIETDLSIRLNQHYYINLHINNNKDYSQQEEFLATPVVAWTPNIINERVNIIYQANQNAQNFQDVMDRAWPNGRGRGARLIETMRNFFSFRVRHYVEREELAPLNTNEPRQTVVPNVNIQQQNVGSGYSNRGGRTNIVASSEIPLRSHQEGYYRSIVPITEEESDAFNQTTLQQLGQLVSVQLNNSSAIGQFIIFSNTHLGLRKIRIELDEQISQSVMIEFDEPIDRNRINQVINRVPGLANYVCGLSVLTYDNLVFFSR